MGVTHKSNAEALSVVPFFFAFRPDNSFHQNTNYESIEFASYATEEYQKAREGNTELKGREYSSSHLGALSSVEATYGKLNIGKLVLVVEGPREDKGGSLGSSGHGNMKEASRCTASFNNMRTPKFNAQPTNAFFATIN